MAQILEFLVQGSASQPYHLMFQRNGSTFRAHCSCPGGEAGAMCKHRRALIEGDARNVVSGNSEQVRLIPELLAGTDAAKALEDLVRAEKRELEAKTESSALRRALARIVNGDFA